MKKFITVAGVLLVASLGVASVATGVYSNKKSNKSYAKIDKFVMSQEEKAQKELEKEQDFENVEIGEGKVITSTKHISDAFISGDTKDLSEEDKETLEEAKKVYTSIIKDDMSMYDKEKAIYDWMYDNLHTVGNEDVSSDEPKDTITGALKGKVTEDYTAAMTFRLLNNMAGIDCMIAHDRDEFYYTIWNICKLDDNCWYYVNVYDDMDSTKYWHFNCGKDEEEYSRGEKDFPEANGSKYCFALGDVKDIKEPEDILKGLKKACGNKEKEDFNLFFSMSSEDMKKNQILDYLLTGIESRVSDYNKDAYFRYSTFEKDGKIYVKTACYGFKSDIDTSKFKINYDDIDKKLNEKIGELPE